MRRLLLVLLVLLMIDVMPVRAAGDDAKVPAADDPAIAGDPSAIEARAWLLMDGASGRVLLQQNGDLTLPMASTTKIMTAILALELGKPDDLVTAGEKPYETGGTTIYLEIGEQQSLQDLLYALMLESANDAAVAIAEHLAGSEEKFAALMNEKARVLGATRTNFVNSHGLHDPNHYTTAHDLALIARYAMQNPAFRQLVATEEKDIPGAPGNPPRKLVSHNRLLGYYPGANGVKNGYTEEAELTNVAAARQGETELIAVVLGARWKLWTSSMSLLDFGFARYETRLAAPEGLILEPVRVPGIGTVRPRVGGDLSLTVERGSAPLVRSLEWLPGLSLPIAPGQQVGWMKILQDGRLMGRVPLVAAGPLSGPTVAATPAKEPEVGSARIWIVLWLGASLALTIQMNSLRTALSACATKEESERDVA